MSKTTLDGYGRVRLVCENECGAYGDGWGSRLGFCSTCKHIAKVCNGVGCKTSRYC